jgi:hypothetical protein
MAAGIPYPSAVSWRRVVWPATQGCSTVSRRAISVNAASR